MKSKTHIDFMKRCFVLAEKAIGNTYQNPLVGAVIVYQNKIIGEGWHQKAGEAHAEVDAINSVNDKSLLAESILYVNLEPCSHFGKTPPCADLIIQHNIKQVVIASKDPNPKVAGKGIEKLKKAGIVVYENMLKEEAEFLNRRFYTFYQKKRPYIIMKWAQTQDGFIAPLKKESNRPFWISNTLSKQKVHQWRSEEASILVGVQTVVMDDPQLTTRDWPGNNPLRLILDPSDRTPNEATVLKDQLATILFNQYQSERSVRENKEQVILNPFSLEALMEFCYKRTILSLFVEGGPKTLNHFIENQLWDEARVFISEEKLELGIHSPKFEAVVHKEEKIKNNKLITYLR